MLDIDGVLTDGGMYYTSSGEEMKKFNTKDGMGMLKLKNTHIKTGILSSGFTTTIGENRAKLLKVDRVYIGREPKLDILKSWLDEMKIKPTDVAFIGDDINDLEIINYVGLTACPSDSIEKVKAAVDINLCKRGGDGCVREFIDEYLLCVPKE